MTELAVFANARLRQRRQATVVALGLAGLAGAVMGFLPILPG